MSAKNVQSDTSRVIVKNPLLSTVAGSIDDFVNNTILLPAAEIPPTPIVLPPVQSADNQDSKDNRDATKSVIYGTDPPAVLDTDKFSEISLDQPVDSELTTTQQEYNPLQNLDTFSPLAVDEQQKQQQQRDEILFNPLAQAAAIKDSLSQLPGVASSVLSSFSSILKGRTSPYPPGEELRASSSTSPYTGEFPESEENVSATAVVSPFVSYYDQSHQEQQTSEPPPITPTFYSPTDPLILRPEASLSPSSASAENPSNLYRLKERKKLYAPIPGLNANNSNPIPINQIPLNPRVPPAPEPSSISAPLNQNASFSFTSLLDKVLPKQSDPTTPDVDAAAATTESCSQQRLIDHSAYSTSSFEPIVISNQSNSSNIETISPFSITSSPSQIYSTVSQTVSPPVLSNSFNLNPFQNLHTQNQLPTAPSASTAQLPDSSVSPYSISDSTKITTQPVKTHTPPAPPQFYNPNSTPYPASAPSYHQSPPVATVSDSVNPFQTPQNPALYQIPRAASPALIQQTPIPPTYLPQSVPPSGEVISYRLQGKPHYKKPIQSTQRNIPNQALNSQTSQLFAPVQTSEPPSIPVSNFQIFNPLAFDNNNPQQGSVYQESSQTQLPNAQIQQPFAQTAPLYAIETNTITFFNQPTQSLPPPPPPPTSTLLPSPPPSVSTSNDNNNLFQKISTSQADSGIAVSPANIFTSFNQTQSQLDGNNLNEFQQHSTNVPPLIAAPLQSQPIVLPLSNPFHSAALNVNAHAASNLTTETAPIPAIPVELESFHEPKQLSEIQPISTVEQITLNQSSAPIDTNTNFTSAVKPSTIQNFFDPSTFDPFQVQQDNFDLDNTKHSTNIESKNLEHVNSGVESLSLDEENNFIEDSVANEPTETVGILESSELNTFDPTSYFNNNNNNFNNSDSPSDQCASVITSNTNDFQIQNFFNEPPPLSDLQENVQENNFNFIRTNLLNKRIERIANAETASPETLSVASIIAEPGSSAPSERSFAESRTADGSLQPLPSSFENNPDQADGINIYSWLNKQESAEMVDTPTAQTSPPATSSTSTNIAYRPVYKHWFYKTTSDMKRIWIPFSFSDSMLLESSLAQGVNIVTTDGGRFDVNIEERTRTAAYWTAESNEVRRCSWFYKGKDFRLIPYEENVAEQLEEEYKDAATTGEWQRKIPLTSGETVVFNGPSDILHYLKSESADSFNNAMQNTEIRPRAVRRGTDEFAIDEGEPEQIDHLLFMVHGIGGACDLKFRKVEEVVDEFRSIALQLTLSHYRSSCDRNIVGRVEVLPISWHSELHSEESGIDEKLRSITLESIPKLRNFTNDTLLDILFYTSPVFCQQIVDAVSGNLNKCYAKFCERNPSFHGSVSVSGHSLGSLILFDLLQHQRIEIENSENLENSDRTKPPLKRHCSQQIKFTIGNAGTGQPYISYSQLSFQPKHFFALGSPIGMFVTVRGLDALGLDFKLPTTEHFFNIFHPYDPVAYRIEALVNPQLINLRPVLVPHHKGRKRMHLELRETVARVGADIKQKILNTIRSTVDTVYSYTTLHKGPNDTTIIQQEVDKVIDAQLTLTEHETSANTSSASSEIDTGETDLALGRMNGGRRIDYVLQEAPLEIINEYIFALASHVCYWGSEDATLFIIKEIYSSLDIQADTKIPQPSMTIERPSPANSAKFSPTTG